MTTPVVFCDFDGTITEEDNIIAIMNKFAPPEWKEWKQAILEKRISIKEGVGNMFSLLPSYLKDEIIEFVLAHAKIRPGFSEFLQYAEIHGISVYILSGGIDFFVEPILKEYPSIKKIYCNSADFSGENIEIKWPNECDEFCLKECGCCKPSVMRDIAKDCTFKVIIGDSITDLEIARQADFVFARDYLVTKCKEESIPYSPFNTFFDCIQVLNHTSGVIGHEC